MPAVETAVELDEPERQPERETVELIVPVGRYRYRLRISHRRGMPIASAAEAQTIAAALAQELTRERPT